MVLNIKQSRSLRVIISRRWALSAKTTSSNDRKSENERRRWLTRITGNGPETYNFEENFSASEYRSQFKVRRRSCLEIQVTAFSTEENWTVSESLCSRWLIVNHKVRHDIIYFFLYYLQLVVDRSEMSTDTWFRRRNFPYLNSRIFKIHFRTSDRLHLWTNFEVNKHTSALLSTNELNSIQPWKEELFRNSLKEKCALCFKIVLV